MSALVRRFMFRAEGSIAVPASCLATQEQRAREAFEDAQRRTAEAEAQRLIDLEEARVRVSCEACRA